MWVVVFNIVAGSPPSGDHRVPAIHVLVLYGRVDVDARDKRGHDHERSCVKSRGIHR
jgi:hypothetical protein